MLVNYTTLSVKVSTLVNMTETGKGSASDTTWGPVHGRPAGVPPQGGAR